MDFLRDMTSRQGRNLITGPSKTRTRKDGSASWDEHWIDFTDAKAVQKAIDSVEQKCSGVYFALGAFVQSQKDARFHRRAVDCVALKAFWFDVDCGEEKWVKHGGKGCYRTREDGEKALLVFLQATKLPMPTQTVHSGAGLHVYWRLDTDIPLAEWRQTALRLKSLCTRFAFEADPARTADASSVLRVPKTLHKSGAVVRVVRDNGVVSYDQFKSAVDALTPLLLDPAFQAQRDKSMGLGERPAYLTDNSESTLNEADLETPKKFANIIAKSELDGSGCNQLYELYLNQEKVPEPLWSGALSIAKFCVDGEEWAIKISENHPEFDPEVTLRKMEQWGAPRTCNWFMDANPSACKDCPMAKLAASGQVLSPIRLATDDNRVPTVVKQPIAGESGETEEFVIPGYPFPYYRHPELGGVWKQGDNGPEMVYDFDIYIYDRIGFGLDNKPRFWARQHTPFDGVTEMELSTDDLFCTPTESTRRLAAHNVLVPPDTQGGELNKFLRMQASNLQRAKAMLNPPKQMGWTDKGTFVLGKWEYSRAGKKMTPVPDTNIARMFKESCEPRRDFRTMQEGWNTALRKLYGANDAQRYRLILACGFGASIRSRFGSETGGVINIYSEDSGFGKSTLTKVISGIFGLTPDPFFYQARQGTTVNAFFEIISYVNSLPMTLDETGQLEVEDLMLFVHTCTSGRAKARSSSQINDIRTSLPGWKSHVFSSSNVSLWNRITEHRAENEAYLMRIVEIPIRALAQSSDKNYGDEAVREVQKYYGVAGQAIVEYVLHNEEEIEQLWHNISAGLTETCHLHGRHRFWGDIMTAGVVGAIIGERAGVFPFDPKEIYRTAQELLRELVIRAEGKIVREIELFGEMLNKYSSNTIVVKNSQTSSAPIKAPQGRDAYVRIEIDDMKMYVDYVGLREFAKVRQFGIERLESALEDIGAERGVLKRMWDNTEFKTGNPPVRVWKIDLRNPKAREYINPGDFYENREPSDGDGETGR